MICDSPCHAWLLVTLMTSVPRPVLWYRGEEEGGQNSETWKMRLCYLETVKVCSGCILTSPSKQNFSSSKPWINPSCLPFHSLLDLVHASKGSSKIGLRGGLLAGGRPRGDSVPKSAPGHLTDFHNEVGQHISFFPENTVFLKFSFEKTPLWSYSAYNWMYKGNSHMLVCIWSFWDRKIKFYLRSRISSNFLQEKNSL